MKIITQDEGSSPLSRVFLQSRVFILLCTFLSVIVTAIGVVTRDESPTARIEYHYGYKLNFASWGDVFSDLKQNFQSPEVLESWLESSPSHKLKSKEWSDLKIVDGIKLQKNSNEMLVEFTKSKNSGALIVNTDNLQTLNAIYRYLNFLNEKITKEYVEFTRWEIDNLIKFIETKHAKQLEAIDTSRLWVKVINLQRNIHRMNNGTLILQINRPTSPTKTKLVMAPIFWGGLFGFGMGCLLTVIRHSRVLGLWK